MFNSKLFLNVAAWPLVVVLVAFSLVTTSGCVDERANANSQQHASAHKPTGSSIPHPLTGYRAGPLNYHHLQTNFDSKFIRYWLSAGASGMSIQPGDGISVNSLADGSVAGSFSIEETGNYREPFNIKFVPEEPFNEGWHYTRLFPEGGHQPKDKNGQARDYRDFFHIGETNPVVTRVDFLSKEGEGVDGVLIHFSEPIIIPREDAIRVNGGGYFTYDGPEGTATGDGDGNTIVRTSAYVRPEAELDLDAAVQLEFEGIVSADTEATLALLPPQIAPEDDAGKWHDDGTSIKLEVVPNDSPCEDAGFCYYSLRR